MKKLFKQGDFFIWLTGLGLGISIVMICGLMILIFINGSSYFIPAKVYSVEKNDGNLLLGQITREEEIPKENVDEFGKRIQFKIGNRDVYGNDFVWVNDEDIKETSLLPNITVLERYEFGNFYGKLLNIKKFGLIIIEGEEDVLKHINSFIEYNQYLRYEIKKIEQGVIGELNFEIEKLRAEIRKIEYYNKDKIELFTEHLDHLNHEIEQKNINYINIRKSLDSLVALSSVYSLTMQTAEGREREIPFSSIVRAYQPNNQSFFDKAGFISAKLWEFVFDEPRESNTEGGVFPAIFGTVLMVILMSIAVVPFGVLAALYLREYAKQGPMVRVVRIAVNNLAGVPSIVFGVFGLGFFIYFLGGTIDQLFYPERLPTPTWGTGGILWASLTLSLLTMPVVIVSTEEALASIPRGIREASLALGATKWQTIRRIVLPAATPGILTGLILAMARGAGEVAPLMITGVVKLAPNLPFDSNFPFFHLDRKFMHLGFHIYDVGFQSPNVEAAMPMVYMTTLLLIFIVVLLNITAMIIRAKLRKKYKSSTF